MSDDPPFVSVIIPARGRPALLRRCLQAVNRQQGIEGGHEVIVVDDGSPESLGPLAIEHAARFLRQEPQGPAAARNAGARAARGEILAFTDSDCAPVETWLSALTAPFADPEVVGVKGIYRSDQTGWVPRFVQQEYEAKYRRMAELDSIDFIDTYSAAYRRAVLLENGGFDVSFPRPSVEDQEFSFRLARKGYRLVFAPGAVVVHEHDRNALEYARRKFGIGYWKAFLLRWLPEKTLSDSHTLPAQRWQIGLLALSLLSLALALAWPPALALAAGWLLLFLLIDAGFLAYLARRDLRWLLVAPLMLLLRAGALGCGLAFGIALPPRRRTGGEPALSPRQRAIKRALDIAGSALSLLLAAPLMLIASVAIKLQDGGPVLFRQTRIGEGGRPFELLKLRTMVPGAEQHVEEVLHQNPLEGPVFKIPNDPRVTPVGRFLRRWSLDELPQLWNVLKGEMSLVGPRPEEAWVVAEYNDQQRQRLAFKPGLTGPMQVNGRGQLGMDERLALELEYIQNYSVGRDLKLLARTLPALARGEGAY